MKFIFSLLKLLELCKKVIPIFSRYLHLYSNAWYIFDAKKPETSQILFFYSFLCTLFRNTKLTKPNLCECTYFLLKCCMQWAKIGKNCILAARPMLHPFGWRISEMGSEEIFEVIIVQQHNPKCFWVATR